MEGGRGREGVVLCDGEWLSVVGVAGWALSSMGAGCSSWGIVICGWGMVICGGGWSFVVEGGCLWQRIIVCGGGWFFMVGDHCLWMGVVVCGHLDVWGCCLCGAWSSIGGCCRPSVGCGRLLGGHCHLCGAGSSIDEEPSSTGTGLSSSVDCHVPWMVIGC